MKIAVVVVILFLILLRAGYWFAQLDRPLPACAKDGSMVVGLEVISADQRNGPPPRLIIFARVVYAPTCQELLSSKLRLAWYQPDRMLEVGSVIEVEAKLRRSWGSLNSAGFNYRLWLLSQEVVGTGYISKFRAVNDEAPPKFWHALETRLANLDPWVRALALGDKTAVDSTQWELFRKTGTIHLMVVSGLHVGILGGLCGLVVSGLLMPGARIFERLPKRKLVLCLAASLVIGYAWLTGLQPPVLRGAFLFCALVLLLLWQRSPAPLAVLATVAVVSTFMLPNHLLKQGFWLSYGAVAALVVCFGRRLRPLSWVAGLFACQVVLVLWLGPLVGYVVGPAPVLGGLANLIVVPLVTLLTIPAAMLNVVVNAFGLEVLANLSLQTVTLTMDMVVRILETFPTLDTGYSDGLQLVLGLSFSLLMFSPLRLRIKSALFMAWVLSLLNVPEVIQPGEFVVRILDVGQGSAALVDTRHHRLIVDVGPSIGESFDAGRDVVRPVLRRTGLDKVDGMLVTHHDHDHDGGLVYIRQIFPDAPLRSPRTNCGHEPFWIWDQVRFRTLRDARAKSRNDGSCTLLVEGRQSTAYFAGDIGRRAELNLLADLPRQIQLLVVPHHGSRSSSHPAFVAKLSADWAAISAGRDNRYRHPNESVVASYTKNDARVINTANHGQMTWRSHTNRVRGVRSYLNEMYLPLVSELD